MALVVQVCNTGYIWPTWPVALAKVAIAPFALSFASMAALHWIVPGCRYSMKLEASSISPCPFMTHTEVILNCSYTKYHRALFVHIGTYWWGLFIFFFFYYFCFSFYDAEVIFIVYY